MDGKSFVQLTALIAASALGGALATHYVPLARHAVGKAASRSSQAVPGLAYRAADQANHKLPKPQHFTCPMHPQIVLDHPGNCPICGMQLVKADASPSPNASGGDSANTVAVDTAMQQRMGVVLATAQTQVIENHIQSYATVIADASKVVAVTPKAEGWIRSLGVSAVGQDIHRGQLLYEIYSADLQQRERDYIDLLTRRDSLTSGSSGMDASGTPNAMLGSVARERYRLRERLLAADISANIIDQLERERRVRDTLPVQASHDGVITDISAREGAYVSPAQPIITYTDTARLWVELVIYPDQLDAVRRGSQLKLTESQHPGWQLSIPLDRASLQLDRDSRLGRLRLALPNHPSWLRLGMPLEASVIDSSAPVLAVPRDAVLYSGAGAQVVTQSDASHFQLVDVRTGVSDATNVQIVAGLHAGDRVVVNGHFLIGAEASVAAARQRMQAQSATPSMPGMQP